jgi:MerR family redox-sensitive transcriptional activator SoxR
MGKMRIGKVAQRADVAATTIRCYEREGVLPEPERESGQRVYGPEVLEILGMVKVAQELGFTLEEIKTLLDSFRTPGEPSNLCRELAEQKLRELDELIADARKMKGVLEHGLTCRCTSLQGCYVAEK